MRAPLAAFAFAVALSSREALAQRAQATVTDATRQRAWIDAGADDGLMQGARWEPSPGVELTLVAVSRRSSAIAATRGALPRRGATITLPTERAAPPPPVSARDAPTPTAPWEAAYATGATPWIPAVRSERPDAIDDPFDDDPRRRPRGVRGEISLRLLAGLAPGTLTRSYQDLGLVSQVSAAWGSGWFHDHLIEARVVAAPEVAYIPFQNASARVDVYLLRAGYAPVGSAYGVEFGRLSTLPGAAVGVTDGARVRWRALGSAFELAAFAGVRPDVTNLAPAFTAPRAGASVRARFGSVGHARGRIDASLVVDAWNTSVDRAFATVGAGFDYRALLSINGEAVLDFAPDAAQRDGVRVTRAIADARLDLLDARIRIGASAGLDRPLYTSSLVAQVASLPVLPVRRFASLRVDVRASSRLWTFASARASDDPDGLRALATDAGVRVVDLPTRGSYASLRARYTLGDRVNGYGAHTSWSLMLNPLTHLEAGYGIDQYTFGDNTISTWSHRLRVGGDRRFGARWRTAFSYEASWGAFSLQHVVFLLVGYRLG